MAFVNFVNFARIAPVLRPGPADRPVTTAQDWSGRVGDVWADEWRRTDRAFAGLAPHLDAAILAAAPPGALRALDIGCGAGSTAMALAAARADAAVTGVDLSPGLVAIARERAGHVPNLGFLLGDALDEAAAQAPLDLFVSRHGVMFFADPVPAFARLAHAAAPRGRLVFSCFAAPADNPWATILAAPPAAAGAAPGPFAFAEPGRLARILADASWRDAQPERIDFAYVVGAGEDAVADAAAFLRRIGPVASALRAAAPADRPALDDRLVRALAARAKADTVAFPAAAWIWTAVAPGELP